MQIRQLYKVDNYIIYIIIQIRQLYKLGCFNLMSLRISQTYVIPNLSNLRHSESLKPISD